MKRSSALIPAVLSLCASWSPAAPLQEDPGQPSTGKPAGLPMESLVLRYYTPRAIDEDDLLAVASELFADEILVVPAARDRDRLGDQVWLPHFLVLENSIIVRDSAAEAERILATFAEIELKVAPPEDGSKSSQRDQLETLEYSPRFVSVDGALTSLQRFRREILVKPAPGGGSFSRVDNITASAERGTVFVRETPEKLAEIQAFLARMDVPAQQATFTLLVLEGRAEGPSSAGLPDELVRNLSQLVPSQGFEQLATGVLRGSVRSSLELNIDVPESGRYSLSMRPAAFDPQTGTVTLEHCQFLMNQYYGGTTPRESGQVTQRAAGTTTQSFQTSAAALRSGEYTVLGAVGANPVFVVLRMTLEGESK